MANRIRFANFTMHAAVLSARGLTLVRSETAMRPTDAADCEGPADVVAKIVKPLARRLHPARKDSSRPWRPHDVAVL